jgi:CheY-like chemotaxis protein
MNNRSDRSAQEKFATRAQPMSLEAGDRGDRGSAFTVSDEHPRNRRILVITDNEHSAKLLGDAFEANTYDVSATSNMYEAVRFTTTCDPGSILLMLPSLAATCDAARQLRQHTSINIIAFSKMSVTAAERNVALQSGCDDYREAFLRINKRG